MLGSSATRLKDCGRDIQRIPDLSSEEKVLRQPIRWIANTLKCRILENGLFQYNDMYKTTYKFPQIDKIALQILGESASKTLCFNAPMGAGKTTLIKAILKELGAADTGHSPTFGIVNEYHDQNGGLLAYHFDFYRLDDEMEALDMGLDDYLSQDVWIFIEWPEKIPSLLPEDATEIRIEIIDKETRHLTISG